MRTISEADYDKLCKACDALLEKHPTSITRNANALLHVVREHPIFLSNYQIVFTNSSALFYLSIFKKILWNSILGVYKLFHSLYRNFFKDNRANSENFKADYLFLSHLLNQNLLTHKNDFYFFDLPESITNKNQKSLLLYINFTGLASSLLEKKREDSKTPYLVLPQYLPFKDELLIRILLVKEASTILFEKTNTLFEKRVKLLATLGALSSPTFSNLRLAKLVQHHIKKNKPNYIFTTYEGHAWERIIFFLARKINPGIKCIGYQHSLIFRKQHAIRRKLADQFEPDFILFSGIHSRKQFLDTQYLSEDRLLLFGSNRTSIKKPKNLAIYAENKNTFLMLSEGDLIECIPMTQLVLKLAKKYVNLNFIIRFHPITKVEQVFKICPSLKTLPSNILLSDRSFEADLERAHFALYRGSSTIIKAVQYGLIPVYFESKDEISIDPLYELHSWKVNIDESGNLDKLLRLEDYVLKENQENLIKQVDQFFSPIDYTIIKKLKSTI